MSIKTGVTLVNNNNYFNIEYRGGFIISSPGKNNRGALESMHADGLRGFRRYVNISKSFDKLTEVGRRIYDIYDRAGTVRRKEADALKIIDEAAQRRTTK